MAFEGSQTIRSLKAWMMSRTVSSSAAARWVIAGAGVPNADGMMTNVLWTLIAPRLLTG